MILFMFMTLVQEMELHIYTYQMLYSILDLLGRYKDKFRLSKYASLICFESNPKCFLKYHQHIARFIRTTKIKEHYNQCCFTISNAEFSTLKLPFSYFSVANKLSILLYPSFKRSHNKQCLSSFIQQLAMCNNSFPTPFGANILHALCNFISISRVH